MAFLQASFPRLSNLLNLKQLLIIFPFIVVFGLWLDKAEGLSLFKPRLLAHQQVLLLFATLRRCLSSPSLRTLYSGKLLFVAIELVFRLKLLLLFLHFDQLPLLLSFGLLESCIKISLFCFVAKFHLNVI